MLWGNEFLGVQSVVVNGSGRKFFLTCVLHLYGLRSQEKWIFFLLFQGKSVIFFFPIVINVSGAYKVMKIQVVLFYH